MALPFQNLYHLRLVAESSAKACFMCKYKSSTSVLITPDKADFFYICPGHLTDKGFASPVGPTPEEKRKEDLEKEVERVKAEWEERQKRKKEREKEGAKEKDKEKEKEKEKEDGKDKDKKDKEDKNETGKKEEEESKMETATPRIFTLQKKIFEIRVNRARQQQQAKRNMERLQNPSMFPSVPKGGPI
ncbi:VPS4-associated protein 1 [Geopyxis carbonaria]|nr:VPS4-associated protein 1 [Geopyxis carbonaria]